jgi:hypothetical protein
MTNPLAPIIIPADVDVYTIPRRPFDFRKGDRRFGELDEAVEHANEEARKTGVRQVIRTYVPFLHGGELTLIVQAVGS